MKPVRDSGFKYLVREYADKCGLDDADLCKRIGLSPGTLYTRLKNPDTLRLGELRTLARILRLPEDRLISAIKLGK
jgi:hypothetical protein